VARDESERQGPDVRALPWLRGTRRSPREYPNSDLIRAELVRDVVTARQIAAGWKDAAMAKGFAEL